MNYFREVKKWLGEITEIVLLLIALAIGVEILFGPTVPFFGSVISNITTLLSTLGDKGFVGLIALGVILFIFQRRKADAHS